jgi:hypothetical protein
MSISEQSATVSEPAQEIIVQIKAEKNTIHWIVLADMVNSLQTLSHLSERRIAKECQISKSEVHRLLLLSEMHINMKLAAAEYNTEKYVFLEWMSIQNPEVKNDIKWGIESGRIRLRKQFHSELKKAQARV